MTSSGDPSADARGGGGHLNIQGVLECPICLQYLSGNILQCRDGHIICESCYNRLSQGQQRFCPTCKTQFPLAPIRNRALENIAERVAALELVDPAALPEAHAPAPPALRTSPRPRAVHTGVKCNGEACAGGGDIVGCRYMCAECADFNICDSCASTGVHGEHMMIRIPNPVQTRRVAAAIARLRESRNGEPDPAPAAQPPPTPSLMQQALAYASSAPRRILSAVRRTTTAPAPAPVQVTVPMQIDVDAESDDTDDGDINESDGGDGPPNDSQGAN